MKKTIFILLVIWHWHFTLTAQYDVTGTASPVCIGQDGSIDLQISGGEGPFDVQWYNTTTEVPQLVQEANAIDATSYLTDIDGLDLGSYQVKVFDRHCAMVMLDFQIKVTEYDVDFDVIHACHGSNGSIDVTITGDQTYKVVWEQVFNTITRELSAATSDGNDGSEDLQNLTEGTYRMSVSTRYCPTAQTFIIEIQEGGFEVDVETSGVCQNSLGSITLSPKEDNGPYMYNWSNNMSTATIDNLNIGSYDCTVTNGDNCSEVVTAEIKDIGDVELKLKKVPGFCKVDIEAIINSDLLPFEVHWEDINTGNTISSDWPKQYNTLEELHINPPNLENQDRGIHYRLILIAGNCAIEKEIHLPSEDEMVDQIKSFIEEGSWTEPVSCEGASDGFLRIKRPYLDTDPTFGGFSPNLSWHSSNPAPIDNYFYNYNLPAGEYCATMTLGSGDCGSSEICFEIGTRDYISNIDSESFTTVDGCKGSIHLRGTWILSIYNSAIDIKWDNPALSGIDNTDIPLGTYKVTLAISDSGCEETFEFQVGDPSILDPINVEAEITSSCSDCTSGSIILDDNATSDSRTYKWDIGNTSNTLINIPAGDYCVTVIDNQSLCFAEECYTVEEKVCQDQLRLELISLKDSYICDGVGACSGSIKVNVSSNADYIYRWYFEGVPIQVQSLNISDLCAGNYHIEVFLSQNVDCQMTSMSFEIEDKFLDEQKPFVRVANKINPRYCEFPFMGLGSISIEQLYEGQVQYQWYNEAGILIGNHKDISGLVKGTYTLVAEVEGCSESIEVLLCCCEDIGNTNNCGGESGIKLEVTSSVQDASNVGINDGAIVLSIFHEGIFVPIIDWEGIYYPTPDSPVFETFTSHDRRLENLYPGYYTFTVSNGCEEFTETLIVGPLSSCQIQNPIQASIDRTCGEEGTILKALPEGGVPPYSIEWSEGSTTEEIEVADNQLFQLTVTDSKGCYSVTEMNSSERGDLLSFSNDADNRLYHTFYTDQSTKIQIENAYKGNNRYGSENQCSFLDTDIEFVTNIGTAEAFIYTPHDREKPCEGGVVTAYHYKIIGGKKRVVKSKAYPVGKDAYVDDFSWTNRQYRDTEFDINARRDFVYRVHFDDYAISMLLGASPDAIICEKGTYCFFDALEVFNVELDYPVMFTSCEKWTNKCFLFPKPCDNPNDLDGCDDGYILCPSEVCPEGTCGSCTDGIQNGQESGTDCGGPECPECPYSCTDGLWNGNETGVDCGGPDCDPCPTNCNDPGEECPQGQICDENGNCIPDPACSKVTVFHPINSNIIRVDIDVVNSITSYLEWKLLRDGYEEDRGHVTIDQTTEFFEIDMTAYEADLYTLEVIFDESNCGLFTKKYSFGTTPTCNDGVQNGNEDGIDCGGSDCPPCITPECNDGVQNGDETGVDCGGPECPPCPTCDDGVQNGDETEVDCGGSECPPCPTCNDGVQNGDETGVDCGGPNCDGCPNACPTVQSFLAGYSNIIIYLNSDGNYNVIFKVIDPQGVTIISQNQPVAFGDNQSFTLDISSFNDVGNYQFIMESNCTDHTESFSLDCPSEFSLSPIPFNVGTNQIFEITSDVGLEAEIIYKDYVTKVEVFRQSISIGKGSNQISIQTSQLENATKEVDLIFVNGTCPAIPGKKVIMSSLLPDPNEDCLVESISIDEFELEGQNVLYNFISINNDDLILGSSVADSINPHIFFTNLDGEEYIYDNGTRLSIINDQEDLVMVRSIDFNSDVNWEHDIANAKFLGAKSIQDKLMLLKKDVLSNVASIVVIGSTGQVLQEIVFENAALDLLNSYNLEDLEWYINDPSDFVVKLSNTNIFWYKYGVLQELSLPNSILINDILVESESPIIVGTVEGELTLQGEVIYDNDIPSVIAISTLEDFNIDEVRLYDTGNSIEVQSSIITNDDEIVSSITETELDEFGVAVDQCTKIIKIEFDKCNCDSNQQNLEYDENHCALEWNISCPRYQYYLQKKFGEYWSIIEDASSPYSLPENSSGSYRLEILNANCDYSYTSEEVETNCNSYCYCSPSQLNVITDSCLLYWIPNQCTGFDETLEVFEDSIWQAIDIEGSSYQSINGGLYRLVYSKQDCDSHYSNNSYLDCFGDCSVELPGLHYNDLNCSIFWEEYCTDCNYYLQVLDGEWSDIQGQGSAYFVEETAEYRLMIEKSNCDTLYSSSIFGQVCGNSILCTTCDDCNLCPDCPDCTETCSTCENCEECSWCPDCVIECNECLDCNNCPWCPDCEIDCSVCTDCNLCPDCPDCVDVCTDCVDCSICPWCPDCEVDCSVCTDCNLCPDCPDCVDVCTDCVDCSICPWCLNCDPDNCHQILDFTVDLSSAEVEIDLYLPINTEIQVSLLELTPLGWVELSSTTHGPSGPGLVSMIFGIDGLHDKELKYVFDCLSCPDCPPLEVEFNTFNSFRSIKDRTVADFSISCFPNPSNDEFTIDIMSSIEEFAKIAIIKTTGERVLSDEVPITVGVNRYVIPSNITEDEGVYYFVYKSSSRIKSLKMVKIK